MKYGSCHLRHSNFLTLVSINSTSYSQHVPQRWLLSQKCNTSDLSLSWILVEENHAVDSILLRHFPCLEVYNIDHRSQAFLKDLNDFHSRCLYKIEAYQISYIFISNYSNDKRCNVTFPNKFNWNQLESSVLLETLVQIQMCHHLSRVHI